MHEPKPIASLSAGLLARKGAARPAMRRQVALSGLNPGFGGHDDLGWNDMGYDVDPHHTLAEETRPGAHGLSPMHGHEPDPEVRNALNDAVERAITDRGAGTGDVDPIVPDAPVPVRAEPPLVHRHFERIAQEIAPAPLPDAAEVVAPPAATPIAVPAATVVPLPVAKAMKQPRARAGTKGSFAFTLRLDPERHLRLRLASASSNRSAQAILVGLLDDLLASQPEIAAFAAQLPVKAR